MTTTAKEEPTILLACEGSDTCNTIIDMLRGDGLDTRLVQGGTDTLNLALEIEADVVVGRIGTFRSWIEWPDQTAEGENRLLLPPFLLLADELSAEAIARAIGDGVDDFTSKSDPTEVLLAKVHSLLARRRLRLDLWSKGKSLKEANALLETNFKELTTIVLKMLEVRVPGTSDRADTAKAIADFLTERLGLRSDKRRQIIFAALLHEIGKVGLPDEIVGKHYRTLQPAFVSVFNQHVTVGSMVASTVTGYREAEEAIHHQLENLDGSGFPDGLVGEEIPIGARILRAIVFHEELRAEGVAVEGIVEQIRSAMHTILDQRIANLVIEFLLAGDHQEKTDKTKVAIDDLSVGMVVAEDIFAASGVKLLPKGVELHEKTLALLRERNETDPIIGGVYVVSRAE
jgi:response regulator RpfG family c-di-GMP phosphodiesterase